MTKCLLREKPVNWSIFLYRYCRTQFKVITDMNGLGIQLVRMIKFVSLVIKL